MITYSKIDEAFNFYNIDNKYKTICYNCADEINNSKVYSKVFNNTYKQLYFHDFKEINTLWDIKDINVLFTKNINPFITNIMILLGYDIHSSNMKKFNLNNKQILIHKQRVKECFENDLIRRNANGVRISQMLWAIYFIRVQIIEVGILQYQFYIDNDNKQFIKIHIPRGNSLNIISIQKSLTQSKNEISQVFKINDFKYICNSWLLSNQIYNIINKDSNIAHFHDLFNVIDGENCETDILNFVYELNSCENYSLLPENTSLQKNIKKQLLKGNTFYLGLGTLK